MKKPRARTIGIVYWKECPAAAKNIVPQLKQKFGFREKGGEFDGNPVLSNGKLDIYCANERHVDCNYAGSIPKDTVVFCSTHKSEAKKPMLSTHPIGNFGKAELGGKERELVKTSAFLMKNYLLGLKEAKKSLGLKEYAVGMEATHHGPWLEKPCCFIELGSSEREWGDRKAGFAVAKTIAESTSLDGEWTPLVGIGEGHYAPGFSDIAAKTEYCFGHICPLYNAKNLDSEMLEKMLAGTIEEAEGICLDERNMEKEEFERIKALLDARGKKVFQLPELKPRK